jgi:TRAP-type C4-dicarboxylate transport system substrate-binding protein
LKRYSGLIVVLLVTLILASLIVSCATTPTTSAPPTTSTTPPPKTSAAPPPATSSVAPPPTTSAPAPTSTTPPATQAAQPKMTLRFAIAPPPGDELAVNAEEYAAAVAKRTNGQYVIKVYAGETMIKLPETYDAVRTGAVEMCNIGIGIFEGMDPRLAELPMSVNNIHANAAACQPFADMVSKYVLEPKLNMKCFASYCTGAQELWSTKPIKNLADWKGLLVGSGNPESAALITGLGGSPVNMSWTDFYTALQKKTVDAVMNSIRGSIVFSIPDVSKYLTTFYGQPTYNGFNINLDTWKKLPPDVQQIFVEEAKNAATKMIAYQIKARETTDIDVVKKAGVTVYDLPKADHDIWQASMTPYITKRLADMGDFGIQEKAMLDKVNADNP